MKNNLKDRLLKLIESNEKIKNGVIVLSPKFCKDGNNRIELPKNYTKEQYQEFLNKLDMDLDDKLEEVIIDGWIWLNYYTYITYGEYQNEWCWLRFDLPKDPIDQKFRKHKGFAHVMLYNGQKCVVDCRTRDDSDARVIYYKGVMIDKSVNEWEHKWNFGTKINVQVSEIDEILSMFKR